LTDAPQPISANPGDAITALFKTAKAVIGVVHLAPLPGAPRYDGEGVDAIYDRALADARAYLDGGCDAVMVENHGDIPFAKPDAIGPEVPAHMAVIADRIHTRFGKPVGVNVLANAPIPALAVASAASAGFIRVNQWANAYVANEGLLDGEAAAAMRYRAQLRAKGVRIFADAHVKHGAHAITGDRAVEELVRDLVFFDVDAIIATGQRTGHPADLGYIQQIKAASDLPTLVGSGVNADNVAAILAIADGVIVASSLKQDGVWWNPVDPGRVRGLVKAARG
jgi:membrane complex biogenesis BtpA family protein